MVISWLGNISEELVVIMILIKVYKKWCTKSGSCSHHGGKLKVVFLSGKSRRDFGDGEEIDREVWK